jgi:hypothetical protein
MTTINVMTPGKAKLVREALEWQGMGVSPIPVRYMSKAPLLPWTPWVNKVPPKPLAEMWFTRHWPCNLGLVLREGLCVVDFDERRSYQEWAAEMPHLAKSRTVHTRRGMHVYLWAAEYDPATTHFEGGEVKTNGIVIAPPSLHPSGRAYIGFDRPILGVAGVEDLGLAIKDVPAYVPPPRNEAQERGEGTGLIAAIKQAVDIGEWLGRITTLLPHRDGTWMAVCPFHDDDEPSLQVWPHEGRCYCHAPGCVAHRRSDVIACAAWHHRVSMSDAVHILAMEL